MWSSEHVGAYGTSVQNTPASDQYASARRWVFEDQICKGGSTYVKPVDRFIPARNAETGGTKSVEDFILHSR
jgi:hypothetical protein